MTRKPKFIASLLLLGAVLVLSGCIGRALTLLSPHSDSKLEHITSATFDQRVLQAPCPVLLDFYAEWCGPCKQLSPILEEIALERPDVRILKANVDENRELSQKFGIQGIPHLLLFRGGQKVAEREGFQEKAAILALIGPPPSATAAK